VKLPAGKAVVPGVVTHKTNVLEHPEVVAGRIMQYAEAVGRENVIAGTDCGMGGRIHPQLAWAKLRANVRRCRASQQAALGVNLIGSRYNQQNHASSVSDCLMGGSSWLPAVCPATLS
jgi:hypothetical protein